MVLLSGCGYSPSPDKIYLVTRNFKQWEIWAIPLAGDSSTEVLYTLPANLFWREALDLGYLDPAV